jgi:nicotinic acid phosphoribosyltransferase
MSKTMTLITSNWGSKKTFKLIPVSNDAVYNECIYDIDTKMLAIISKEKKDSMHMVAKLTDVGDVQYLKIGKRPNGKDFAEERKTLETYYEYYVEDVKEIEEFIKLFAINAETFDFKQYFNVTEAPSNIISGL